VPGFDLAEPRFVDFVGFDLFVEMVEVEDVDLGPRIFDMVPVFMMNAQSLDWLKAIRAPA
jgi:hypothetical protein